MKAVFVGVPGSARRATQAAVVMVCTAALLATATGQALAKKPAAKKPAASKKLTIKPTSPVTKGSTYLALGDSVTFGYEEAAVVPAPNYQDAANLFSYPGLLGSALHVKVVNAACPGETSASLIDATAQSNGCEHAPGNGNVGYRTAYPLHVSYSGSQLAFAVRYLKQHKTVRLVSLMIGANDGLMCQETTADHCTSLTEQAALIVTVAKNVHTILSQIRNKAGYHGQLAIVNYYSTNSSNATDNSDSQLLNQAVDNAAKPFHVEIADGYGEFAAASAHAGGDSTCTAGLLTELVNASTPCGIHPSYAGAALLAQALEKAIRLT